MFFHMPKLAGLKQQLLGQEHPKQGTKLVVQTVQLCPQKSLTLRHKISRLQAVKLANQNYYLQERRKLLFTRRKSNTGMVFFLVYSIFFLPGR